MAAFRRIERSIRVVTSFVVVVKLGSWDVSAWLQSAKCRRCPTIIACGTADIESDTRTLQSVTTFCEAMTAPINSAVYDSDYGNAVCQRQRN
jgi:hypothetical protein